MGEDDRKEEILPALAESSTPGTSPNLEDVFEEHSERVFRAAYRITGDAADAEDVLQNVFLRLMRRDIVLDPERGLATYLKRAAVNASLDLLRSRRRSRAVPLEEAEGNATQGSSGPEQQHAERQLRRQLRKALLDLTPQAAEIFALRYFEGYGNLEIAHLLGMSQTAVGVALHRARNRIQKSLEPWRGETPGGDRQLGETS